MDPTTPPTDDTILHWALGLWSGLLTVLGALVGWSWNKMNSQIDGKADQEDVDQLRESFREQQEVQERMHRENRERLDDIYQLLATGRRRDHG